MNKCFFNNIIYSILILFLFYIDKNNNNNFINCTELNKIKIGLKNNQFIIYDIENNIYEINTNFKQIGFKIYNFKNINSIKISDNINLEESNLFQNNIIKDNNTIIFFENKFCIEKIYLTFDKINIINLSYFYIDTFFILDENNENIDCVFINNSDIDFCAQSNYNDCKNCLKFPCIAIHCGYEEENPQKEDKFVNNKFL